MFTFLGDVQEAVNKIRQYVESESTFFNEFLEEGMRFSSSLYLMLIWIRVLKFIFQSLNDVAERMKKLHPFFKDFLTKRTTEAYIDGLCQSLKSICIGSAHVKKSTENCKLSHILSMEPLSSSDDDGPPSQCRRLVTDDEDDEIPSASQIRLSDEDERSPSPPTYLKNTTKRKRNQRKIIC